MARLKYILLSIFAVIVISLPFLFSLRKVQKEKTLAFKIQTREVPNITARVGEFQINSLAGWGSPYAEIELRGQGTARKTTADKNGRFQFLQIPIRKDYGEFCLTSIDVLRKPTLPICLPKLSFDKTIDIDGVLLPPSFSVEGDKIASGRTVKASGMTFPNSEVDVYLFENYNNYNFYKIYNFLFPPVYAAGMPKYTIKSNQNGYFEFSLPAFSQTVNRLFSTAFFVPENFPDAGALPKSISPKSNTLSYEVFKPNLWLAVLLILALLAIILTRLLKKKQRALTLVQNAIISYKPSCETETPFGHKILRIGF